MEAGGENIARLYTGSGDRGTTALVGGSRIEKDAPRIRAYGTYDELGAYLGLVEVELPPELTEIHTVVRRLQNEIYVAQAELATPPEGQKPSHLIEARHVTRLEANIEQFQASHGRLHSFVLSGGTRPGALLQIARTIARRAEREVWVLHRTEPLRPEFLSWANRLSGLLFALALAVNQALGVTEVAPDYSA